MKREDLTIFDRLTALLEEWAEWQSSYRPKTGYPSCSAGFGSSAGVHSFEDMCERSDSHVMDVIDAAIDGLAPAQNAAINRRYGQASVYRFPRNNHEEMLLAAHETLAVVLVRKGIVL